MPARTVALRTLKLCRTRNGWADALLKDEIAHAALSHKDAALCTTLCMGVLQNQALLDYYIDMFLSGKKHLPPSLRDILRLASYQIVFLDRIPESAAVNEAVKHAKYQFSQREADFCNALLRNMLRHRENLFPPQDYSIRYSHPEALIQLIKDSVGKQLGTILEADNTPAPTYVQVNTLKTTSEELLSKLTLSGAHLTAHAWMPGCYLMTGAGDITQLESFQQGLFQIQDPAARLSVSTIGLVPGMRVLDLCSAPGGKSIAAAILMRNKGEVVACDIHKGKLPQIIEASARMGTNIISIEENDATVFRSEWENAFDVVIADVPCSGLGVIRKKPDIRYRSIAAINQLPQLQKEILRQARRYVRSGGVLLYSTCTILKQENQNVVRLFLDENPEFSTEILTLPKPLLQQEPGLLSLYQGVDQCDGFFICKMRKS